MTTPSGLHEGSAYRTGAGRRRARRARPGRGGVRSGHAADRGRARLLARVGEVRCPSRAEWNADFAASFSSAYTNLRDDYTVLSPTVCEERSEWADRTSRPGSRRSARSCSRTRPTTCATGATAATRARSSARRSSSSARRRSGSARPRRGGRPLRVRARPARVQGPPLPAVQGPGLHDPAVVAAGGGRIGVRGSALVAAVVLALCRDRSGGAFHRPRPGAADRARGRARARAAGERRDDDLRGRHARALRPGHAHASQRLDGERGPYTLCAQGAPALCPAAHARARGALELARRTLLETTVTSSSSRSPRRRPTTSSSSSSATCSILPSRAQRKPPAIAST